MELVELFSKYLDNAGIEVNKLLLGRLVEFRLNWSNKDDTYIEFLSSGLIGAHNIRFSKQDEGYLFVDILNLKQDQLQKDIYKVPGINRSWKVSSNVVNVTLITLMHLFYKSNLSKDDKHFALQELYYIFAYKNIGSIYYHYYPYPIDRALAVAVYESLTNKFLIKKLNTWENVLVYQGKQLLPPSKNLERIEALNGDNCVRVINDLYTKIKDIINNVTSIVYNEEKRRNNKIYASNPHVVVGKEGEESDTLRDTDNRYNKAAVYLKSIINYENDFIVNDYITLVASIFSNFDKDKLKETLLYISYNETNFVTFDYPTAILELSFNYLRRKGIVKDFEKQVLKCLNHLKNYFGGSKVKEESLSKTRKHLEKVVTLATGINNNWRQAMLVVAVMCYMFLRSITRPN